MRIEINQDAQRHGPVFCNSSWDLEGGGLDMRPLSYSYWLPRAWRHAECISYLGTWYKLLWFCQRPSKSKLPHLIAVFFGSAWVSLGLSEMCFMLVWSGDGALWAPNTKRYWNVLFHRFSFLGSAPSTLTSSSKHTHSDSLLGLIVFPVFFRSLSASIHPVLVAMATGEIQSQYLLAASVTQPSTRIAGSCFCVCLMFPSLKLDASGQGRGTRSIWFGTPPLRQSSGTSSLCVCVRARALVSLSALERRANKFSLCQNSLGGQGGGEEILQILLQGSSALQRYILVVFLEFV